MPRTPGAGTLRDRIATVQTLDLRSNKTRSELLAALDSIDSLVAELEATKTYAAEGWAWLEDALDALGAKTVFDIPRKS